MNQQIFQAIKQYYKQQINVDLNENNENKNNKQQNKLIKNVKILIQTLLQSSKFHLNIKNFEDIQEIIEGLGLEEELYEQPSIKNYIDSFLEDVILKIPTDLFQEVFKAISKFSTTYIEIACTFKPSIILVKGFLEDPQENLEEDIIESQDYKIPSIYQKNFKLLIDQFLEKQEIEVKDYYNLRINKDILGKNDNLLKDISEYFYEYLDDEQIKIFKEDILLSIIMESKNQEGISGISSNCASLYSFMNFSFTGLDLQKINISGANLKNIQAQNTNFKDATLQSVNFSNSFLNNANFSGANLLSAKFGDLQQNSQEENQESQKQISSCDLSINDRYMVLGYEDGILEIIDLNCNKVIYKIDNVKQTHKGKIFKVKFSNNMDKIATSGKDKLIKIWKINLQNPKEEYSLIHTFVSHSETSDIAFTKDDRSVLMADGFYIQNLDLQKLQKEIHIMGLEDEVQGISIDSMNKCVFVRNYKQIYIGAMEGAILRYLQGHTSRITAADSCPMGSFVISGDANGCVKIWDRQTGNSIGNPQIMDKAHKGQKITTCRFTQDGLFSFSGGEDGSVRGWSSDMHGEIQQLIKLKDIFMSGIVDVFPSSDMENIIVIDKYNIYIFEWLENNNIQIKKIIGENQKFQCQNTDFTRALNVQNSLLQSLIKKSQNINQDPDQKSDYGEIIQKDHMQEVKQLEEIYNQFNDQDNKIKQEQEDQQNLQNLDKDQQEIQNQDQQNEQNDNKDQLNNNNENQLQEDEKQKIQPQI